MAQGLRCPRRGAVNADEGKTDALADTEDGDEPPRRSPDRDPNAPSEAEVKKGATARTTTCSGGLSPAEYKEARATIAARFSFQLRT